jgi:hypothetical protein
MGEQRCHTFYLLVRCVSVSLSACTVTWPYSDDLSPSTLAVLRGPVGWQAGVTSLRACPVGCRDPVRVCVFVCVVLIYVLQATRRFDRVLIVPLG